MWWEPNRSNERQQVRELLEANGFGWDESQRADIIIRSRSATGLGERDLEIERIYFRKYKFRRLLYYLVDKRNDGPYAETELGQKAGLNQERLQEYLSVLAHHRLANNVDDRWSLAPEVKAKTLGPTFEAYVALRFNLDLHWQAASGVKLKDFKYNDFDVVAIRGQNIVVVECKISPDNIQDNHVEAFLERHSFLAPDFSVLLVDSDRSPEQLATRVNDYVLKRIRLAGRPIFPTVLDPPRGNAFSLAHFIYVANTNASRGDGLLKSLQLCLHHHHSRNRLEMFE